MGPPQCLADSRIVVTDRRRAAGDMAVLCVLMDAVLSAGKLRKRGKEDHSLRATKKSGFRQNNKPRNIQDQ